MPIKFACPYCEKISSVPDSFAGKKGKCPSCQKLIEVPDPRGGEPAASSSPSAAVTMPPPGAENSSASPPRDAGGGEEAGMKDCRYCGESIRSVAKKCKFCGEFLDSRLKADRRGGTRTRLPLAEPVTRLGAKMIDWGLDLLTLLPAGVITAVIVAANNGRDPSDAEAAVIGISWLVCLLFYLVLNLYQWYLIHTRGATLGKGWMKIKIVQQGGGAVSFVDGVILRNWVLGFIIGLVNSFIPCLGTLLWLVDVLMIFGTDHRTLHDQIASTLVVKAPPPKRELGV